MYIAAATLAPGALRAAGSCRPLLGRDGPRETLGFFARFHLEELRNGAAPPQAASGLVRMRPAAAGGRERTA